MTPHTGALLVALLVSPVGPLDPLPPGAVQRLGSPRFRHGNQVVGSALSPDGKRLATAGRREVVVWDTSTGKRLFTFPYSVTGGGNPISHAALAISPTNRWLLVNYSGAIVVWDLATGRQVLTPEWAGQTYCLLRFGEQDDEIDLVVNYVDPRVGRHETRIETYGLPSGKRLRARPCDPAWRHEPLVGGRFGVQYERGLFQVVEWGTERVVFSRIGQRDEWYRSAISPDGRRVARITEDGWVEVVPTNAGPVVTIPLPESLRGKVQRGQGPEQLQVVDYWVGVVGFSDDGAEVWVRHPHPDLHYAITAAAARPVHRWDAATGKELPRLPGHSTGAVGVHYPSDGRSIVTVGHDGTIRRWDRKTGKPIDPQPMPGGSPAFSPDGSTFATASDGCIAMFDTRTGRHRTFPCPFDTVNGLAVSSRGVVAVGQEDKAIALLDSTTGRELRRLRPDPNRPQPWVWHLRFTPDGKYLTADGPHQGREMVVLWEVETGQPVWSRERWDSANFTANGQGLAIWNDRKTFQLCEPTTGKLFREMPVISPDPQAKDPPPYVNVFTASADGRLIAAGYDRGPVVVQDLSTGELVCRLPVFPLSPEHSMMPPQNYPTALGFSADGKWLAVGASDQTVQVWEVASGTRLVRFTGHNVLLSAVRFAPDGRTLWSASWDGLAYRWNLRRSAPGQELPWPVAWVRLTAPEAADAAPALWAIADDPAGAVPFLRTAVLPPSLADRLVVTMLVHELGNEDYLKREAAAGALLRMGSKAVPALREAVEGPNAEVRTRASRLLVRLDATIAAEKLRLSRVVQALELAGTADARKLLEEWAATATNPQLARESAEALARLRIRNL